MEIHRHVLALDIATFGGLVTLSLSLPEWRRIPKVFTSSGNPGHRWQAAVTLTVVRCQPGRHSWSRMFVPNSLPVFECAIHCC